MPPCCLLQLSVLSAAASMSSSVLVVRNNCYYLSAHWIPSLRVEVITLTATKASRRRGGIFGFLTLAAPLEGTAQ